jgi:hypothetical protein
VTSKVAVDILKRVGFKAKVKDNSELFADYYINDGETPDIVADRVYGNSELHWVVLLFNDIVNPDYDWALASPKLESFIKKKYPGTAFHIVEAPALGTCGDNNDQGYNLAKFRRNMTLLKADGNSYTSMDDIRYADGSITSGITYGASLIYDYMKNGTSTYVVTNRSYEEKENEGKRIIKLPRPDMIQLITKEYERLMQD